MDLATNNNDLTSGQDHCSSNYRCCSLYINFPVFCKYHVHYSLIHIFIYENIFRFGQSSESKALGGVGGMNFYLSKAEN